MDEIKSLTRDEDKIYQIKQILIEKGKEDLCFFIDILIDRRNGCQEAFLDVYEKNKILNKEIEKLTNGINYITLEEFNILKEEYKKLQKKYKKLKKKNK